MTNKIYFVTGNNGKFKEVKTYIEKNVKRIEVKQFNADISEIQTMDQREISIKKAISAWKIVGKPLIVDDAGIYFEKYNKFPGTMTKYIYKGIGFDGIKKLINNGDKAFFRLYLTYIDGPNSFKIFEAKSEGIIQIPKTFTADVDLPYSSIFIPNGSNKNYEELRHTKEGEKYLYRIKALKAFINWFKIHKCND